MDGLGYAVKQHSFNADVIVKIFEVAHRDRGATNVHVDRGRGMR